MLCECKMVVLLFIIVEVELVGSTRAAHPEGVGHGTLAPLEKGAL